MFEASRQQAPDRRLFLEHVHFTLEGHWLAAQAIGQKIVRDVLGRDWDLSAIPTPEERDAGLGVIAEDQVVANYLTMSLYQSPPLSHSADAKKHQANAADQLSKVIGQKNSPNMAAFMRLDHATKIDDLVHGMGQVRLKDGEPVAALRLFELSQRRRPWMPHSYLYAAICRTSNRDYGAARQDLLRSLHTPIPLTSRLRTLHENVSQRLPVAATGTSQGRVQ